MLFERINRKLSYKDSRDRKKFPAFFMLEKMQSGLFALYNKKTREQICNPTEKLHRVQCTRTTRGSGRPNDSGFRSPERLGVQADRTTGGSGRPNDSGFKPTERLRVSSTRTIGVQATRTTEGSGHPND